MQLALGTANWLLGKVLNKLSSKLVEAWVASSELSSNMEAIKRKLWYTHGMLHEAQKRDVRDNQGLLVLLHQLSNTADQAEDMLDELDYFLIQDELYNTQEAAAEVHGVIVVLLFMLAMLLAILLANGFHAVRVHMNLNILMVMIPVVMMM